jgi:hypothetical protein
MSTITFSCPHCKQSIDAPVEAAGALGDCPNCQKEITVPAAAPEASQPAPAPQAAAPKAAPQGRITTTGLRRQMVRPMPGGTPGALPGPLPQPKKSGKGRVIFTLLIGLALGYAAATTQVMMGYGFGKKPVAGTDRPPAPARLTREAWKTKVQEHFTVSSDQVFALKSDTNVPASAKAFKSFMGDPGKTETVGEETHWYYDCSDGRIKIVINSSSLTNDIIAGAQISDNEPKPAPPASP